MAVHVCNHPNQATLKTLCKGGPGAQSYLVTQALLSCMQTCVAKSPESSAVTEFCMNFKTFHLVLFPSVWRARCTLQRPRAVEKKDTSILRVEASREVKLIYDTSRSADLCADDSAYTLLPIQLADLMRATRCKFLQSVCAVPDVCSLLILQLQLNLIKVCF